MREFKDTRRPEEKERSEKNRKQRTESNTQYVSSLSHRIDRLALSIVFLFRSVSFALFFLSRALSFSTIVVARRINYDDRRDDEDDEIIGIR